MTQTDIIETINSMDNEQQTLFYNSLRENGLSEDEVLAIQGVAFYTKLYNDPTMYMAVRDEMGRQIYKSLTREVAN